MTLEQRLGALDRAGERSLTQQIVDLYHAAIAAGELAPGAKLPATRRLAVVAGVNQLTAGRCYRRLAEMGVVVSEVGRGTFVRSAAAGTAAAAAAEDPLAAVDPSWQTYVLPPERTSEAGRILREMAGHADMPGVIAMSAGQPPLELVPHAELRDAAAAAIAHDDASGFQYGSVEGTGDLREQLARLGRVRGLDDDADGILVTTGARQGLTLVARAVLRPGDRVACESPTFMGLIEALRGSGADLLPVPVDEHGLDTRALERLLHRHEIRLLALQSRLHNPTGHDLSSERRARVVELAVRHGFFILEDGVYADLRLEGEDPGPPLRALAPSHVIYVDSLSKTVAPGLRIGWIAASGPVLDRLVAEKRSDDIHTPTLTQQTAAHFLSGGHYVPQLARARLLYRERRDALVAALDAEMADLATFARPPGGGHVWLTLRHALDDAQLYREALAAGVTFIPGSAMLIERPRATHLRLSYGLLPPDLIDEGVRRLARVVRALHHAPARRRSLPVV